MTCASNRRIYPATSTYSLPLRSLYSQEMHVGGHQTSTHIVFIAFVKRGFRQPNDTATKPKLFFLRSSLSLIAVYVCVTGVSVLCLPWPVRRQDVRSPSAYARVEHTVRAACFCGDITCFFLGWRVGADAGCAGRLRVNLTNTHVLQHTTSTRNTHQCTRRIINHIRNA